MPSPSPSGPSSKSPGSPGLRAIGFPGRLSGLCLAPGDIACPWHCARQSPIAHRQPTVCDFLQGALRHRVRPLQCGCEAAAFGGRSLLRPRGPVGSVPCFRLRKHASGWGHRTCFRRSAEAWHLAPAPASQANGKAAASQRALQGGLFRFTSVTAAGSGQNRRGIMSPANRRPSKTGLDFTESYAHYMYG